MLSQWVGRWFIVYHIHHHQKPASFCWLKHPPYGMALEDLLKVKRASARLRDQADAEELARIHQERGPDMDEKLGPATGL